MIESKPNPSPEPSPESRDVPRLPPLAMWQKLALGASMVAAAIGFCLPKPAAPHVAKDSATEARPLTTDSSTGESARHGPQPQSTGSDTKPDALVVGDTGGVPIIVPDGDGRDATDTDPESGQGTADGAPSAEATPADDAALDFSPLLLNGGLSFFVCFCIGFATRNFVRLAMVFFGFNLIATCWFASLGWIDVNWSLIQEQLTAQLETFGRQLTSFREFIVGSLPSSASAGLGLIAGLKKK